MDTCLYECLHLQLAVSRSACVSVFVFVPVLVLCCRTCYPLHKSPVRATFVQMQLLLPCLSNTRAERRSVGWLVGSDLGNGRQTRSWSSRMQESFDTMVLANGWFDDITRKVAVATRPRRGLGNYSASATQFERGLIVWPYVYVMKCDCCLSRGALDSRNEDYFWPRGKGQKLWGSVPYWC